MSWENEVKELLVMEKKEEEEQEEEEEGASYRRDTNELMEASRGAKPGKSCSEDGRAAERTQGGSGKTANAKLMGSAAT